MPPAPDRPTKLPFTLTTLKELDFGKIPAVFDAAISRCVADCEDRPLDDKNRVVTLKVIMAPKIDAGGSGVSIDGVMLGVEITDSIPKRRTQVYEMKPTKIGANHGLMFHPEAPEDPDANLLYDKETGEVKEMPDNQ